MIEKIRKKLILKYTVLLTFILLLCFGGSYTAYRYSTVNFVYESLKDYLSEEVWEAREYVSLPNQPITINKVNASINSLHNFAYWFVDGKLVHAEEPENAKVAAILLNRLKNKVYSEKEIYHENIKYNKQKWYFILLKKHFFTSDGRKGEVVVLANYTPVRKNTKTYVKIAIAALVILSFLAFLIGNWLASRSMEHIEIMYQKQKQFVSDAAHELRTPLSILLSYTELLEYKPDDVKLVGNIKEQILQIGTLLDNLLTIARYDNRNMPMNMSSFDLCRLASEVTSAFSRLHRGISLQKPEHAVPITADAEMLRQLMYILLDNAVKYSGNDKKIVLGITQNKNETGFYVTDNGIGIEKQDLTHIFERFWRADKSRNSRGLGLGLSLARLIVELHGGQIKVKSEPGCGSTFDVILPAQRTIFEKSYGDNEA